jgi:DNA-binding MarR family transcriptional regulator
MNSDKSPDCEPVLQAIERIQQLAALFNKRRAQLAARVGITEAQWKVLEGIATEHFMPSMFAHEQDHTRGAVSKIIRPLLRGKLISVAISAGDGRRRRYELTAEGKKTMSRLREARNAAIRKIWGPMSASELVAFTRVSDLLIARIKAYVEKEQAYDK